MEDLLPTVPMYRHKKSDRRHEEAATNRDECQVWA